MKKIFFLAAPGQINSAFFNRFMSICKATRLAGYQVEIVSIKPLKSPLDNNVLLDSEKAQISYENFTFQNIVLTSSRNLSVFGKVLLRIKTYWNAIQILHKRILKRESVIYIMSLSLFENILFFFVARVLKAVYVRERSEYPGIIRSPDKIKTFFFKYFELPWSYKLFDGMVIMTNPLIQFYSRYTRRHCKIAKVPMSVDAERFSIQNIKREKYIGYVGSLDCQKDGLDILIKAFKKIHQDFPEFILKIVGVPDFPKQETFLLELSKSLSLDRHVELLGGKKREEIPEFLCKASLLVLARPESKQAEGGFPTKLGEYLATGNPVIVTDVGEITNYIKDGIDAYVIKPGSVNELAESMKNALANEKEALNIGENGKHTCIKYFDYRSQAEILKQFYDSF